MIVGGSAVTMGNWIDKVSSIVDVWYPGEEGGHAVAAVLSGVYIPGGKLPITFPISEAQLHSFTTINQPDVVMIMKI